MKEWKRPELTILGAEKTAAGGVSNVADSGWITDPNNPNQHMMTSS